MKGTQTQHIFDGYYFTLLLSFVAPFLVFQSLSYSQYMYKGVVKTKIKNDLTWEIK